MARLPKSKTKEFFLELDKFSGGTNTLISERRLDKKYAVTSQNLWQVDDGIWETRPGTGYYGEAISDESEIDGAFEFVDSDGDTELLAIADGSLYKSTDGGSWSLVSEDAFTAGIKPFFLQSGGKLYITNGTDDLAYYDGTSLSTYSSIANPDAPDNASRAVLTSGDYNNYYRVVWTNDVGFTEPSDALNITTDKHRDTWASDGSEYVSFDLPEAAAGVTGVEVYWGQYTGEEVLLEVLPATATSYSDDGQTVANIYVEAPDDNTTASPKFKSLEISGNRLWGTYDSDNRYRVYFSGTGQYLGHYSPFYGGGYVDIEKGSRNNPVAVTHYRTGKGDPSVTVLCSSPDGYGTIFQIALTSVTIGDTSFTVPAASKIVGSIGAVSPWGVVKAKDDVLFLNALGVYALRSREQIFNVLSTDDLSSPIRNEFEDLNSSLLNGAIMHYKPPRVYMSLPKGSANDRTAIFDLERGNWNWAWVKGFEQFLTYTDTSGVSYFLAVPSGDNRLLRISESVYGDNGASFYQNYISPLMAVSEDVTDTAKVREVIFQLGDFAGTATVVVLGLGDNQNVETLASKQATSSNTANTGGWGQDRFSTVTFSETSGTPTITTQPVTPIKVRVNEKTRALQFQVYSNSVSSRWKLLNIQAKGTIIPGRAPSSW
jgi:hypothetical protein